MWTGLQAFPNRGPDSVMRTRPAKPPSSEGRLFADICGSAALFGSGIAALFLPETVSRAIQPLGWIGFLILWLATWGAVTGIALKWFRGTYRRYLDLADAIFPTPMSLQGGYRRIIAWKANPPPLQLFLMVILFAALPSLLSELMDRTAFGRVFLDAVEPFHVIMLILCCAFATVIPLFVFACFILGLSSANANTDSGDS